MTRLRALVALLCAALLLSGCDFSVDKVPLPGGADTGEDPMTIKVQFKDVLDLVPQSTVKLDDVTVGKVTEVNLTGYTAEVVLEVRNDIKVPDNTRAELRQTSLLGEKFVSLEVPDGAAASGNLLGDGDTIPLDRTGRNPEVEEVLGAMALLLNGGGVGQLKTITTELNAALDGNDGTARSLLTQVRQLMRQLDDGKQDIVAALEGLNRLSKAANDQMDTIDAALEELPSALDTIDEQRDELIKMLDSLNRLSDVGVRVIKRSKADTIETLKQLDPVLTQFANSGDDFANAFSVFLTYPFVDEVVGRDPQVARNLHMGDYTNLSITLDLDLEGQLPTTLLPTLPSVPVSEVCRTLQEVRGEIRDRFGNGPIPLDRLLEYLENLDNLCDGAAKAINTCLSKPDIGTLAACLQSTLGTSIRDLTQDTLDNVCSVLGIPQRQCPQLPAPGGGGSLPPLPSISLPIPSLPTLGLPRAGYDPGADAIDTSEWSPTQGPTMGQLMEAYDPALVSLMVPGMVTTR